MKHTLTPFTVRAALLVILQLVVLGQSAAFGTPYTIIDVGTLDGPSSRGYGINDAGQVVGQSTVDFEFDGDYHAFLWENGTMTDLGDLGGSDSSAFDVNNAGQVVGFAETGGEVQHPFRWENGTLTDLAAALTPDAHGSGWGINAAGQVVGHRSATAFIWEDGSLDNLGSIGGSPVRAYGINDSGQVVGKSGTRAFIWEDDGDPATGDMRNLGTLPGGQPRAGARGINDSGQVVGKANFGSTDLEDYHAVLWENLAWDGDGNYTGDITDLGALPGGQRSFAYAVNNAGQVVGSASSVGIGGSHAFLYDPIDGLQDLNDLIPPGSGWLLTFAWDINQSGQISGTGIFNGQTRGFIMTPIPEPGTLPLLVAASALAALALRGKKGTQMLA